MRSTDLIAQLQEMSGNDLLIHNISHYGDSSTKEMSLPLQIKFIETLADKNNWIRQLPDAIFISAGGNDVAGDQFCISLNHAQYGVNPVNTERLQGTLQSIRASYLSLLALRDRYAPGVPVFCHTYDFPAPTGVHPLCSGPWLKPSLDYYGWDFATGVSAIREILVSFKNMLLSLAADADNKLFVIDTQGILVDEEWANELHPGAAGFQRIAKVFDTQVRNILMDKRV